MIRVILLNLYYKKKKIDRYLHLILTTTSFIKIVDLEQVQIEIKKKKIFTKKKKRKNSEGVKKFIDSQ